jgi:hypothetical protein
VLKRKFIAMSSHIRNPERFLINNLMIHLKLRANQEQANQKINRQTGL